jgi:uncharacterized protein (TIGR03437 family)
MAACTRPTVLKARLLGAFLLTGATAVFASSITSSTPLPANTLANAAQLDAAGNLYLAGFYFANPQNPNAPAHAFVAKLTPDASQTVWWTTLAGSNDDRAMALALGPNDSVYVTGKTQSTDFPTTPGAMATSGNTFAAELNASGAVVYSTYIPATSGQAIAVDAAGHAFITGPLAATDALQATPGAVAGSAAAFQGGYQTAYILELTPSGTKAILAIIGFGGNQIALGAQGDIYAAGAFADPLTPTTPGAFQPSATGNDCFAGIFFALPCAFQHIAKIDPTGTQLIYATYLSGTWGAIPNGLALDSAGNAILAGTTNSPDYPTTPAAYQPEYFANPSAQNAAITFAAPPSAGYVTKLNATGTGLVWSTFFGGSGGSLGSFLGGDSIVGMAIDAGGNVLIAGFANSADLPGLWSTSVASRPVAVNGQSPPGFVARLSADGGTLSPAQLLNGFQRDMAEPTGGAIAVLADGSAVAAGSEIVKVSLSAPGRVTMIADPADNAKLVSVAPGQLLTLYGTNLAPEGIAPSTGGFPTSFNGVTITFDGIAAPILYTASNQINLQVPYEISGQTQVTMQVASQSVSPTVSESYILAVAARQPSVFVGAASFDASIFDIATCNGQSIVGLQPLAFNADGSMNSCANPAVAGSTVTIFLNGLGVTSPPQTTGAIASAAVAISPVAAAGSASGLSGAIPTETLPGEIASVVQVQVPAAAPTSTVTLGVSDASGAVFLVRGPGVVIWVAPPAGH